VVTDRSPTATARMPGSRAAIRGSRPYLRRGLATVLFLLALVGVTACGGALNDYSATERSLPNSVSVDAGPLALRHLRVELDDALTAGGIQAVLRGSFLNLGTQPDALLRVTTPVAAAVTLSADAGENDSVVLRPGSVEHLQHPADPGWVLDELNAPLAAGSSIEVTFHFAAQGRVTAQIPITTT
jgi:copper(I)-binding protein